MIERILIVGIGSIGKRHLQLARELMPRADIRVLRHLPADDVPEYANGCFVDIEEAVAFAPHMAVIASPAPFHLQVAQALADAGVNLLVEKPLSTTPSGVMQLLETVHKRDILISTGYNLRFFKSLQRYRDLLGQGIIGKILSVRCDAGQYLPSWRPDQDYRKGVSARHLLGGGVLLELSHELDYLRWIFGEVDWVKATLSRQSQLEIDVEDTAHITIGFVPLIEGQQLISVVNLDFIRHDTTRSCTSIGEKGSLRWNGLTGEVELFEAGSRAWQRLFQHQEQRDDSYMAEWKSFLECLDGHKIPIVTGEDGLKVLQIIEAVRFSEMSGGIMTKVGTLKARDINP